MKYEKPEMVELDGRARNARGQERGCVSGESAGAGSCGSGAEAFRSCSSGDLIAQRSCTPGFSANAGDCLSGMDVSIYCEAGGGGSNDPAGCINGPSFA